MFLHLWANVVKLFLSILLEMKSYLTKKIVKQQTKPTTQYYFVFLHLPGLAAWYFDSSDVYALIVDHQVCLNAISSTHAGEHSPLKSHNRLN